MLTVNPVDDVPIIREYIEDIVLYEDFTQPWSVNLNEVFLDIDGALTFTTELEDTTLIASHLKWWRVNLVIGAGCVWRDHDAGNRHEPYA